MKTARITLLVEYRRDPPKVVFNNLPENDLAYIFPLAGCTIIGEPKVEADTFPRCGMSMQQYQGALEAMEQRGGSFVRSLVEPLLRADSIDRSRLLDTFHDLIWSYVPVATQ